MFKMIKTEPTKEQIKRFGMRVTEEDMFTNYKVPLATFDDALRREFLEAFTIDPSVVEGKTSITLTRSTEI